MELVRRTGYDADHATFRDSVRRFVADRVTGEVDCWRAEGRVDTGFFEAAGELGFLGTAVPEEHGGAGVDDPRFPAVLVEELAAAGATGLALVIARQVGLVVPVLTVLAECSEDAADWLAGLAAGELVASVAVLSGESTSFGVPGAAIAGVFLLVDPDAGTVTAVPRDRVEVRSAPQLGGAEASAGDVSVDPAALDGAPSLDVPVDGTLDLWTAVVSLSAARSAFELTASYVQQRAVFGRPLASFENTRFRLAELGAELVAAQQLVDSSLTALAERTLSPSISAATRMVTARVHDQVVDQGMQLHGGYGYMREYPISHAFGDARFVRVAAAALSEPREVLATSLGLSRRGT